MSTFETKLDNVCGFIGLSIAVTITAALGGFTVWMLFAIVSSYL